MRTPWSCIWPIPVGADRRWRGMPRPSWGTLRATRTFHQVWNRIFLRLDIVRESTVIQYRDVLGYRLIDTTYICSGTYLISASVIWGSGLSVSNTEMGKIKQGEWKVEHYQKIPRNGQLLPPQSLSELSIALPGFTTGNTPNTTSSFSAYPPKVNTWGCW